MTPITGLDLTGFTEREPGVWTDAAGLVLSVHFFPLVPDLPAPLHETERLGAGLAQGVAAAGGGLIEAVPGAVDGVPALRQLVKMPLSSRPGQAFLGTWTIPRAGCSTVLKVQAAEGATTGMREAMIMAQVGPAEYFRPHPYVGGQLGGLPYHVGDHEQWDARFPDHPLTLVRATLNRITPTVTLDERFKALPPFTGPAAQQAPQAPHGHQQYPQQYPQAPQMPQAPHPSAPQPPYAPQAPQTPPRRGWFRRSNG